MTPLDSSTLEREGEVTWPNSPASISKSVSATTAPPSFPPQSCRICTRFPGRQLGNLVHTRQNRSGRKREGERVGEGERMGEGEGGRGRETGRGGGQGATWSRSPASISRSVSAVTAPPSFSLQSCRICTRFPGRQLENSPLRRGVVVCHRHAFCRSFPSFSSLRFTLWESSANSSTLD